MLPPRLRPRASAAAGLAAALVLTAAAAPAHADGPPEEPAPEQAEHDFSALLFTATTAFRHDSIPEGIALFESLSDEYGFDLVHTEDSSIFNEEDLADFDVLVMLQASGDPWSQDEKAAMEAYQQDGGGIVAIHNAADMRGGYDWWDGLVGSLMPAHAATGQDPGLEATVQVEDGVHPSTAHLEQWEWNRGDEWYNFSTNVRGDAHVLLTMDETTYDPGGEAMGYDHPISWCKAYDGGRAWVTAMGHFGSHYSEPELIDHFYGGVQWAAGAAEGDCGGTDWGSYDKVALDGNTSAPFGMDVAPDGRVFFTEVVRGQIRVFDPQSHTTSTALDIDVYSGGEDGMLGLALDPDFEDNGYLYQYYSPPSDEDVYVNRLSRFTVDAHTGVIDPDSESVVIEVPKQRFDQPGHTGGDVAFDPEGNLLLSVGDDINPHTEPSPRSAPLSAIEDTFHDARATSANTDDLRGKLLRITPEAEGGYTVPDGNMFEPGTEGTRPEIYAMGFRNPFRFSVDPATGDIGLADYGPDCDTAAECGDYGPTGTVSWSLISEPGNYGWPMCHGGEPYRDVDYTTDPRTFGELFDCDNPVNDSPNNTGLSELAPVTTPDLAYGYQTSTVPEVIAPGSGLAPMGGPFYDFDPELESDTKFPAYFDGKPFFYEWSKNELFSTIVDHSAEPGERLHKINPFLPDESWLAPIDMEFGPDGSLYVLEWGGGFGRDNPDSGLYRVDYVADGRSPVAEAAAEPDSGPAPLDVQFTGSDSHHPEDGEEIVSYEWDFTNNGEVDSTDPDPEHTYTEEGEYNARLTVAGSNDKESVAVVPIVVGNTRPTVEFDTPPDGGFFEWGDEISWSLEVTDPEDEEIDPANASVQPGIGHDDHVHHTDPVPGLTGSVATGLGGHSRADNAFYTLEANYTDQGTETMPPLTGTNTAVLQPKTKQAEHHVGAEGVSVESSTDVEVGNEVLADLGEDAWSRYDPVNFTNIDQVRFRVASGAEGGAVELRSDGPDGDLLATAEVPDTGGVNSWTDVEVDAPESTEPMDLHLVYTGEADFRLNFFEVVGQGVSPAPSPQVSLIAPEQGAIFDSGEAVELAAHAEVAEGGVESVEFYAGDELIGSDDDAPFEAAWSDAPDGTHLLRARAVTQDGAAAESRSVRIEVGDEVVRPPWRTFTNREAEFSQMGEDSFAISAQGANAWEGTDEYGAVFLPGAAEGDFWAQVQVVEHDAPNTSSKAGLIVRNDVTAPGEAGGYLLVHRQGSGDFEALWDTSGDGTPDTAAALDGGDAPQWVAVEREGDLFRALASTEGETWEEFAEVEIADAAETLDVGMFTLAHDATAFSEAEFADFLLESEADEPAEPDEPIQQALEAVAGYRDDVGLDQGEAQPMLAHLNSAARHLDAGRGDRAAAAVQRFAAAAEGIDDEEVRSELLGLAEQMEALPN